MPRMVEYLGDEQLEVGLVAEQDKKKVLVTDPRGRTSRLAPDKVLFRHSADSVEALAARLEALAGEVDVPLLWETLVAEEDLSAREAPELARLYFDTDDEAHASAVFRALLADRTHFRRKGKTFEPRSAADLEQLREQRDTQRRAEQELAQLVRDLRKGRPDAGLCERLERHLRGAADRQLAGALEQLAANNPEARAFEILVQAGHLPPWSDLEVVRANLRAGHPDAVLEHAASLELPPPPAPPAPSAFSIDDEETREVDDALSVGRDGDLVRIDIDIADVAHLVRAGDPVDQEALRRATTVYLPTGIYMMLPERLGCDLLSLHAGQPRPALRTTVWVDDQGQVQRHQIAPAHIKVEQRLDYETADRLMAEGQDATAEQLRLLQEIARKLAARRRAAGAISFQQREFKIRVSDSGQTIDVKPIPFDSPSRRLVAEMMILANGLAARFAEEHGIPVIFRVQPPPAETPPQVEPDDPSAYAKLRGLLQPAALSLQPAKHWGLGLSAYTQSSSPLRRYADLVTQRQLHAGLAGEPPPYSAEELLRVLASAEATEKEAKRLEAAVTTRWALEYVARLEDRRALSAWVLDAVAGGYKVELCCCGAVGLLLDSAKREPGELVTVAVKTVRPRQGGLRMVPG